MAGAGIYFGYLGRLGSFTNKGTVEATNAGYLGQQATAFVNQGTVEAAGGSQLYIGGTFEPNTGVLIAEQGSVIQIAGNFANAATGIVHIDIGGNTPSAYGRLLIGGQASLDGTLRVRLVDGYLPAADPPFDFMTFASSINLFASIEDLDPDDVIAFVLNYKPTGLTLTVGP